MLLAALEIARCNAEASGLADKVEFRLGSYFDPVAEGEVFDLVGLFDPNLVHRDTQDWIVRARGAGVRFDHIDEVLVHRRIHENNMSRSRGAADAEDLFAIVQKKLTAKSAAAKD